MKTIRLLSLLLAALVSTQLFAQSTIVRGEESAGSYSNLKATSGVLQTIINSGTITGTVAATQSGIWTVQPGNTQNTTTWLMQFPVSAAAALDPCLNPSIAKANAIINITTAATTQLVALSASTIVYVCSINMTISQVVTTANTIKFVYGTGASCGTGTTDITGAFGSGGVTAGLPLVVNAGYGGTVFKNIAGNALCATTTIGASAFFTGVLSYVQL